MARPAKGTIMERPTKAGQINRTLRFYAGGTRHTRPLGPVSRDEAERELRHLMADVERGTWRPPAPIEQVDVEVPFLDEFAEQWWLRNEAQLSENTKADYRWRLEHHLLHYFGPIPVDRITIATVEDYVAGKLAGVIYENGEPVGEGDPLSARSINMTTTLLGAILESAVERELITRNPARGKGRRVRERAPRRSYLETAAQIEALLDAAGELDRKAAKDRRHVERRAMLATLTLAGLRIGELLALRWRDVDLAAGWLKVGESKTDAGRRRVKIRGALRDTLLDLRARRDGVEQRALVFPTRTGRSNSPENVRNRVLAVAVKRANSRLEADGLPPLPEGLTPHSLRRTFASLLYALGEPPPVVMDEMGHTDPALALKVYAQAMRRGEDEQAALRALVDGGVWAHKGTSAAEEASEPAEQEGA
jgi:integrase